MLKYLYFLNYFKIFVTIFQLLDECGGSLGGSNDRTASCSATQTEILEFVCQSKKSGTVQVRLSCL